MEGKGEGRIGEGYVALKEADGRRRRKKRNVTPGRVKERQLWVTRQRREKRSEATEEE